MQVHRRQRRLGSGHRWSKSKLDQVKSNEAQLNSERQVEEEEDATCVSTTSCLVDGPMGAELHAGYTDTPDVSLTVPPKSVSDETRISVALHNHSEIVELGSTALSDLRALCVSRVVVLGPCGTTFDEQPPTILCLPFISGSEDVTVQQTGACANRKGPHVSPSTISTLKRWRSDVQCVLLQ
mmetsp:Transcript_148311/g.259211  ORF Transcript_148311/g.259211 Transcript_148311/m.259211 type:complete len:182 (-) Transcript_148311:313-858(-)